MQPLDLVGAIFAAIFALPGHVIEAVSLNPGPWALVGLGLAALLVLK